MLRWKLALSDEEIVTKLGTTIQQRLKKWRLRSAIFNPSTQLSETLGVQNYRICSLSWRVRYHHNKRDVANGLGAESNQA